MNSKGQLAKHTLFTTLLAFLDHRVSGRTLFPGTPGRRRVHSGGRELGVPMIVSLPIYSFLVRKAREKALGCGERVGHAGGGIEASLRNILVTVGLTVFVYWRLFG